jgi:uncharacterized protein YjbJ (UPF0337 family)
MTGSKDHETQGTIDEIKGRGQQAWGDVTGDEKTQAKGAANRAKGQAEQVWGEAKDKASEAKDKVSD